MCVNVNNQLWHPAGKEAENQVHKKKKTKTEQINVCSEITMNNKPINPARRDGEGKREELGTVQIQKEGRRGDCKMLIVNDSTETLSE